MIIVQKLLPLVSRAFRNALFVCTAVSLPYAVAQSQASDELSEIRNWLEQGVNSAILTRQLADLMLEAVSSSGAAIQALIRSQVSEGMNLSAAAKAAVAETFLTQAIAAVNRQAAGMRPDPASTQGKYVSSVDVVEGEIFIAYGNESHSQLAGKVLVLTPLETEDGYLVWQCGLANYGASNGFTAIGGNTGQSATTVPAEYLPSACAT